MNPLDVPPQGLEFQLEDNGRSYRVEVVHLCSVPLLEGLLESSWQDPEDCLEFLEDDRRIELDRIARFETAVSMLCGRSEWTMLTPTPAATDREFQSNERVFGRLCAAVLQSFAPFPVPYWGERGPEEADYSESCVIYVARLSEGLLPESVRRLVRWEEMAKPCLV